MPNKSDLAEHKNPLVDIFIDKAKQWQTETQKLRTILLACGLSEDVKWGQPCYMLDGKNLAILQGFKEYCALMFFKGTLLKDARKLLARPGENAQSSRQLRFTSVQEIVKLEPTVKAYIKEAIEVEKAGLKVKLKTTADFKIPEEFQTRLKEDARLKKAFAALTPGRQRAYLLHFSSAKQSATRAARIEKWVPQILSGKGLDD